MLVTAHLFALILDPSAHGDGLAENRGLEGLALAIAAVAVVVPFAVGIIVANSFALVHVEALLRALLLVIDEAHLIELTGVVGVGPAVGTALGFISGPHASILSVTFILDEVTNLAASSASQVGAVPLAVSVSEAVFGTEDVGAL